MLLFSLVFFFLVAPVAYGSSQARGGICATGTPKPLQRQCWITPLSHKRKPHFSEKGYFHVLFILTYNEFIILK